MSALSFRNVSKSFPGVVALDDVSFDVATGKVHALCGENGAGKSTLLKLLSGVHAADSGEVRLFDKPHRPHSPQDGIELGVAVIHQELQLVSHLTVAENVFLGHWPTRLGVIDHKAMNEAARDVMGKLSLDVDPNQLVGSLPISQRQLVEIGKALSRNASLFAFDEPTSSLSQREVNALFSVIETLRSEGKIVLYVTHRMDEIAHMCDAATVLRDGRHVVTFPSLEGVDSGQIIEAMVGRKIEAQERTSKLVHGILALEVEALVAPGLAEPAGLSVGKGEIVGVFGLVGSGRTELLKGIYGGGQGTVKVNGVTIKCRKPAEAVASGICLCPEDRKHEGIFAQLSVQENICLPNRRRFVVDRHGETRTSQAQVNKLGIKTPGLGQEVRLLSGGNQQKTILARWLSRDLNVMLLDEPTRGIDIGAKGEIYEVLEGLAGSGVGVLFVSSELPEILALSDRILVMREGRIVADVARHEATEAGLLKLALPAAS